MRSSTYQTNTRLEAPQKTLDFKSKSDKDDRSAQENGQVTAYVRSKYENQSESQPANPCNLIHPTIHVPRPPRIEPMPRPAPTKGPPRETKPPPICC
jgi:hypothetical protein